MALNVSNGLNPIHPAQDLSKKIGFEGNLFVKISACIPIIGEITSRLAQSSLVKKYEMDGNASDDKNIVKLKNIYKILDAVRTGLTVLSLETALLVAGSALAVFFGISISPIVSFVAIGAIVALVLGSGAICGYKVYTTLSEIDSNNDKHGLDYISQKRSRPVILDLEDDSVAKLK